MVLWIPGTADEGDVLETKFFSSKEKYNARGKMPLKNSSNGDAGSSPNHHNHKGIEAHPGVLYVRPVAPIDPTTAFQGDVWIRVPEANLDPAYWRSDVTMFGLQGSIPIREAITITPNAVNQAIPGGYHNGNGVVTAVTFDASKVTSDTTIAGTRGTMPMHDGHTPGVQYTVWAGDRFFIMPPAGNYNGVSSWVTAAIPGLTAANLRSGVKVGDLEGVLVEGKRYAEGTGTSSGASTTLTAVDGSTTNNPAAVVSGLDFTPKVILTTRSANPAQQILYLVEAGEAFETLGPSSNVRFNFRSSANAGFFVNGTGFGSYVPGTNGAAYSWKAWG